MKENKLGVVKVQTLPKNNEKQHKYEIMINAHRHRYEAFFESVTMQYMFKTTFSTY